MFYRGAIACATAISPYCCTWLLQVYLLILTVRVLLTWFRQINWCVCACMM